jgi:hypothetical protein
MRPASAYGDGAALDRPQADWRDQMRLLIIGAAVLALGACGSPGGNAADAPANAANAANAADVANAANAANAVDTAAVIANLSQTEQQGVFLRAIRDADIPCRDVTEAEQVEPTNGVPTWRAQCEQGAAHLIIVKPDGSAQVVSRTD